MQDYIIYLIIVLVILLLLMDYYLYKNNTKFKFLERYKDKKFLYHTICLIPVLLLNIFILVNYTKGLIILLYYVLFFFASNSISYIIKKIRKKDYTKNYPGIIAIVLCTAYIIYGSINAYKIVPTYYDINTKKDIPNEKLTIVQITDIHLNTTLNGDDFAKEIDNIKRVNPDILFITGDFIDGSTNYDDLKVALKSLGNTNFKYGVYMVLGNHDYLRYGEDTDLTYSKYLNLIKDNNIKLLQDKVELVDEKIYIIGRSDRGMVPNRISIDNLMENVDEEKYIIILDHQPSDYELIANYNIDLCLSGHTHGGQIFPIDIINDLTGINDMLYGIKKINNTSYIVSSGLSMWGFDLRTSKHSEYVVINISE